MNYINDFYENILIWGKWVNLAPKLTGSYASGFSQLKKFFLSLCTKKKPRGTSNFYFLFTANRPNLGPKLLVVEAYLKEFFTSGSIKVLKKHTKNMLLNFGKKVSEIWLKRCNSHVIAFAERNASQVNGEICPLPFEI